MALAAGRAWDAAGVTSLEALQAPLLITDDALASTVATSPIAGESLAAMADGGIAGLSMWPEDLEHLVKGGCMEPIVAPEQLSGATVRAAPSAVASDVSVTLGATLVFYPDPLPLSGPHARRSAAGFVRRGQLP